MITVPSRISRAKMVMIAPLNKSLMVETDRTVGVGRSSIEQNYELWLGSIVWEMCEVVVSSFASYLWAEHRWWMAWSWFMSAVSGIAWSTCGGERWWMVACMRQARAPLQVAGSNEIFGVLNLFLFGGRANSFSHHLITPLFPKKVCVCYVLYNRVSPQSQICRSVCCRSVDFWLFSNSKIDRSTGRQIWSSVSPHNLSICRSVDLFSLISKSSKMVSDHVYGTVW